MPVTDFSAVVKHINKWTEMKTTTYILNVAKWLAFLTCILEVPGLNLDSETSYPARASFILPCFSS
jgi:hypothetical protein